jgi:hypothetical protein
VDIWVELTVPRGSGQGLAQEEYTHPNGAIDRGAVLDNFRNHGVAHVKIDAAEIPTRKAEALPL